MCVKPYRRPAATTSPTPSREIVRGAGPSGTVSEDCWGIGALSFTCVRHRVFHGGAKSRLHAPGSSGSATVGGERGTPGGSRPSPIHVWWRVARGGWSVSGRYRASDSVTTTRTHRMGQVAGDLEGRASRNGGAGARIHDFKETNKGGGSQAGDGTTRPTTCFPARCG